MTRDAGQTGQRVPGLVEHHVVVVVAAHHHHRSDLREPAQGVHGERLVVGSRTGVIEEVAGVDDGVGSEL